MKSFIIISCYFFLGILLPELALGQEAPKRMYLDLSFGLSQPTGKFSKTDYRNSLAEMPLGEMEQFKGFVKNGNGHALFGHNISFSARYYPRKSFFVTAGWTGLFHEISPENLQNYFDENLRFLEFNGNKIEINSILSTEDYRTNIFFSGFGYSVELNKFQVSFSQLIGLAVMDFPGYSWDYITPNGTILGFGPRLSVPSSLKSLSIGWQIDFHYDLSKKLSLGIKSSFQKADFTHFYRNMQFATSGESEIYDQINFRVINANLSLVYKLR